MTGPEWLELALVNAAVVRQRRAPQPPWWGRDLRRLLVRAFWAVGRSLFDVRVSGLEHFRNRSATIIVANHRTDFDVVLLAPTLYLASGGRDPIARLAFVTADRMFEPGYLATEIVRRPRWLSRLLFRLDLSRILYALRAYPILPAQQRPLRSYLLDVLRHEGDSRLAEVVREPLDELFPGCSAEMTVSEALEWRHREALRACHDLSIFHRPIAKRLRERQVATIVDALAQFAAILDEGDPLFLAPEGELSPNGAFGDIRAGLGRLIQTTESQLRLLPVQFTYDFMASGRPPVFVSLGPELGADERGSNRAVEATVERAITRLGTVTMTQLVSDEFRRAEESDVWTFDEAMLKSHVRSHAQCLARAGVRVDPSVRDEHDFERRWTRFVRYARRRGILRRDHGRLERVPGVTAKPPGLPTAPDSPWAYGANELATLLDAVRASREPACRIDD